MVELSTVIAMLVFIIKLKDSHHKAFMMDVMSFLRVITIKLVLT